MRKLILTASLLAFAVPAAAQPVRHVPPAASPRAIEQMGDRVANVADALMDVDVGPIADAVNPYGRHGPRTLGDMATRRDPYARERLHDSIEETSARLGATAAQIAAMTPVLMQTLQDASHRIKAAMRAPVPQRAETLRGEAPPREVPPFEDDPYPGSGDDN